MKGYVYILTSKNFDCIKIGGTEYPPIKRIKEINSSEPYKSLGPWHLADFREVTDWRRVEYNLHYSYRSKLNTLQPNQKELFYLSPTEASKALNNIDENLIVAKPKVDRMFCHLEFRSYLAQIFTFSGLGQWLDFQGAWTLVLFPATAGGRYFTLNIGSHEVAYSTLDKADNDSIHLLVMDKLILDFPEVDLWLLKHNGDIVQSHYKTALDRAVSVYFEGGFNVATEFLQLSGVRRAMIAYWHEALFNLKDENKQSAYCRFHNYNAVAKIIDYL